MDKNMCKDCVWVELPNKVKNSSVKSWSLKTECEACRIKREAQNVVMAEQQAIEDYEQCKADLIRDKANKIAIEELKKEGKLDDDGEIVED